MKVLVFRVLLLQVEAESEVSEFLSVLRLGTCNVYRRGLEAFQEFYSAQGSIKDFLDRVEKDRLLTLLILQSVYDNQFEASA